MTARRVASVLSLVLLVGAVAGGIAWRRTEVSDQVSLVAAGPYAPGAVGAPRAVAAGPLAGRTVVLDPGHQLGNHNYPRRINHLVPAGGFKKPCNTTGTSTNGGYPEATFAWRVARLVKARLVGLGARVVMTRHSNRQDQWGPCVDVRGRSGNSVDADLKVSIHGDGSFRSGAHGFHVIAPTDRKPWTHDIYRSSRRLALVLRSSLHRAGVPVANYIAGGDGLDFRSDLGTLNLSNIPTVMVELGNMRNPRDAHLMTSSGGRATYAHALARAVRSYLG
ncbi:N-acetylmuramoyl-L-alanine amidase [Nocardioides sp. LS1]|uniref:N-acetylmuramoyl-L-alanine amidase family protein n=1 Tax=Nocardioides sp. LS1 TaxID=1027620 RepID=UPI000FFA5413|nr:N-acetylmuramoyl-L-alanine amidase [Nocardioides sp. LS1]GCD90684.1 N-acetylmuramoyl-L-alanine amidase [Nocardioides sp. LS1]